MSENNKEVLEKIEKHLKFIANVLLFEHDRNEIKSEAKEVLIDVERNKLVNEINQYISDNFNQFIS